MWIKETIKFSFVIPVYNVEKYLSRCLDSIFSQNYSNFEVICVNDGSSDDSLTILNHFSTLHSNMRVISQENRGLGEARNTGAKYVTGDYLWFIDSDDWIELGALDILYNYIKEEGDKDMIIFDCFQSKNIEDRSSGFQAIWQKPSNLDKVEYIKLLLDRQGLFAAWNRVYKVDKYLLSNFHFPQGFYEDLSQIVLFTGHIESIGYIRKQLYYYFYNENSIMRKSDKRIFDIFKQQEIVCKALMNKQVYHSDIAYFKNSNIIDTYKKTLKAEKDIYNLYFDFMRNHQNQTNFSFWRAKYAPFKSKIKMSAYILLIKIMELLK